MQLEEIPALEDLEYLPYLDDNGTIKDELQRQIGVYAIFDRDYQLQFVGYSRDIHLSLKQHLVRQAPNCYWLKIKTIDRPSRTILDAIANKWNEGSVNISADLVWTEPIDTNQAMTDSEKAQYESSDELGRIKIRKQVARRVESQIKQQLNDRGVKMDLRFNPKLKERGLLDLK
jgi:hypothetical protein